jgi:serine/threonine protein kinase
MKKGGFLRSWQLRWFALTTDSCLFYSDGPGSVSKGYIQLDDIRIQLVADMGREHCFGLFHSAPPGTKERQGYFVAADTAADVVQWIKAIRNDHKVGLLDFDILSLLGKGNFGKVMKVRHKETGTMLAMKILRKDMLTKDQDIEHTKTERRLLAKVKHPFVVGLHYAFQTEERLYMVIDYISGGDLYYHLKSQRRFSEATVRIWAAELVLALQYLHQLNVVYRDLKPENLLLDSQGHLHLTDFGLSKVLDGPDIVMHTFCGTPYYLAPEMLVGKKGYTHRVDWWSLGILIFEMLTGQPPFYSNNMQKVYEKIVGTEYTWPPDSDASEVAVDLVTGLLQRDPSRRLGTSQGGSRSPDIQSHPFFAKMDWQAALHKRISTGFMPKKVCISPAQHHTVKEASPLAAADSLRPQMRGGAASPLAVGHGQRQGGARLFQPQVRGRPGDVQQRQQRPSRHRAIPANAL